ncbi:MAG: hypothetical protein ACYTF1_15880 [Planctomycetota bacterium]|jgi:hypothetical protein
MKQLMIFETSVFLILLIGCEASNPTNNEYDRRAANVWMVGSIKDAAINNAIVRQHTLYPYHFIANSAILNELGKQELAVLVEQYKKYPGNLNVRQGVTPNDLYNARLKSVVAAMVEAGVTMDRIKISDGMPGGDGITSERVLRIMEEERTSSYSYSDSSTSGSSCSQVSGNMAAN